MFYPQSKIIVSPSHAVRLKDMVGHSDAGLSQTASFGGVPIVVNHMFPYEDPCSVCRGTGEGETSTYCPACRGGGGTLVEGMMMTDKVESLIVSYLPKRFEPRFPDGLVPLPALCRGLTNG